ncbi:hypothetical protein ACVGVM_08515 [Pseudonocardia bannensis]|uniref:Fibronectin type-III domain-containing protein n=1 Tax=Pseudonocardia bannensis TaxID=630973 RepID=A0A848DQI3_9PSEU|nr:hypothetical protein [Pseudonocardia bannensis]NMH94651.1 hypothetical protein [Pseudonocardia bannensis]
MIFWLRRGALVTAIVLALGTGTAGVAWAGFTGRATAAATASSATLLPATGVSGTCEAALLTKSLHVTWTASASSFEDGYSVAFVGSDGATATVTTTQTSASGPSNLVLLTNTTYTVTVTTTAKKWTAAAASVIVRC